MLHSNTVETPKVKQNGSEPKQCICGIVSNKQEVSPRKFGLKRKPSRNLSSISRIAGGTAAKDNAWPWMAAIVYVIILLLHTKLRFGLSLA